MKNDRTIDFECAECSEAKTRALYDYQVDDRESTRVSHNETRMTVDDVSAIADTTPTFNSAPQPMVS